MLFLPLVLLAYFLSRNIRYRNGVLVIASLLFYGWGEPVWILAMLFSTLVNYLASLGIAATELAWKKRLYVVLGILASLAFLVYFKYSAFFVNTFTQLFGIPYVMPSPRLPIGISFYTFQVLTYTVDVYRETVPVQKNPFRLLLYVSCFPQLIAGPIVQYSDVAAQLGGRITTADSFALGMQRFVKGLAKKVLLANICGQALTQLTLAGSGQPLSVLGAWYAAILYALQIYFDFSAYSDMAIGLGCILGFTYPENFDYPYIASSIAEFWRRWHMTLGAWFRDYLMYPLQRSKAMTLLARKKFPRLGKRFGQTLAACISTLAVWACTGLWHGASWNFVCWGLYYGVLLLLERFVFFKPLQHVPRALKHILTLLIVLVGYVIFYYTDFSYVVTHLLAMLGMDNSSGAIVSAALVDEPLIRVLREYTVLPLIAALFAVPIVPKIGALLSRRPITRRFSRLLGAVLTIFLMGLSVLFLIGQTYNPFIYFRF